MKELFIKEQRLVVLQVLFFSIFLATLTVIGAVVYNKTTIYERQDALEQKRTIEGGFTDLKDAVDEKGFNLK